MKPPRIVPFTFAAGGAAALMLAACGARPQDDAAKSAAPSTFSAPSAPAANALCSTFARDCAFYACLEAAHPCGSDGYALGYGAKYCARFMGQTKLSERGNAWRNATMACLQSALVPIADLAGAVSCRTVTDSAFASHARCYTQPGHSICALPMDDIWTILRTLDADALSLRAANQIRSVLSTCLDPADGVAAR
ncbi:hypothetical protein [Pendulispora albinea]|uniref:Lipoprotein n=1 Tax=Pendulispora albinea TaxID=2741071 RepID=A0ABZ2LPY8_9BACT